MEVNRSALDLLLLEVVFRTIDHYKTSENQEDIQEMAFYRIENISYSIGYKITTKLLPDRSPAGSHLEVVKFICRDYWQLLFGKQIDTLKTNHRGTFVLTDQNCILLHPFLNEAANPETPLLTVLYLAVPCGLIRGALSAFNVQAIVKAQLSAFPICTFDIQVSDLNNNN